jgi:hypothetical protein
VAACAWNQALIELCRRTGDWRLLDFRREVDRRRLLPEWYEACEGPLRRRGRRDNPALERPFPEARLVRWLGPRDAPGNAFCCGVHGRPAYLPVLPGRFPHLSAGEIPDVRAYASGEARRLQRRLLQTQALALVVHLLLVGQTSLPPGSLPG